MRRRDFFGLAIGSATFVLPRLTLAQQSGKLPIIAFLGGATPAMWAPWTGAFVDRLKALGWIDGQTVKLEFRWAEGRRELYSQFAQEFAELNPHRSRCDYCKRTSRYRDGQEFGPAEWSVTGISLQNLDLANKRFELLREVVPSIRRLAMMADATYDATMLEMNTVQALARKFDIDPIPFEIKRTEDIESAFARLKTEQADALYVVINELLKR